MPTYIITADSKPDYDSWGPDDFWSCDDWITWHKALKAKFGKESAKTTWTQAWGEQGAWESNYNWCKYGGVFNAYVRNEDLNATWWLPNILNSATGAIENLGDGAVNATKVLKYIIPALVIAAAVGVLFYAAKKLNAI